MILSGEISRGYLLLEAAISLIVLLLMSMVLFSWHSQLVKSYQKNNDTIYALYTARSIIEQLKAGHTPKLTSDHFHITLTKKPLPDIPTLSTVTVRVYQKQHPQIPLITLISIGSYE